MEKLILLGPGKEGKRGKIWIRSWKLLNSLDKYIATRISVVYRSCRIGGHKEWLKWKPRNIYAKLKSLDIIQ